MQLADSENGEILSHTYVLITGNFVGDWAWKQVVTELESTGHAAVALTLPGLEMGSDAGSASLEAAADQLIAKILELDLKKIILVAHNIAGIPVTSVASHLSDRVSGIIYWSAYVPEADIPGLEDIPAEDKATLSAAAAQLGGDTTLLPADKWRDRYTNTLPIEVREFLYGLLQPVPWVYRTESFSAAAIGIADMPRAFIVGDEDKALPDGWWESAFATRLGVKARIFKGSHTAYFSEPRELATAIISAFDSE